MTTRPLRLWLTLGLTAAALAALAAAFYGLEGAATTVSPGTALLSRRPLPGYVPPLWSIVATVALTAAVLGLALRQSRRFYPVAAFCAAVLLALVVAFIAPGISSSNEKGVQRDTPPSLAKDVDALEGRPP